MSSDEKPPAFRDWLGRRQRRRVETVDRAYGVLGLDYGKGHLDNLYKAAYEHGLKDAYAFTAQHARTWFDASAGRFDPAFSAQPEGWPGGGTGG